MCSSKRSSPHTVPLSKRHKRLSLSLLAGVAQREQQLEQEQAEAPSSQGLIEADSGAEISLRTSAGPYLGKREAEHAPEFSLQHWAPSGAGGHITECADCPDCEDTASSSNSASTGGAGAARLSGSGASTSASSKRARRARDGAGAGGAGGVACGDGGDGGGESDTSDDDPAASGGSSESGSAGAVAGAAALDFLFDLPACTGPAARDECAGGNGSCVPGFGGFFAAAAGASGGGGGGAAAAFGGFLPPHAAQQQHSMGSPLWMSKLPLANTA